MFEQGLIGTGADIAARLLVPGYEETWLTNILSFGQQPALFKLLGPVWFGPFYDFTFPLGRRFPYGLPVTPP